MKNHSLVKKYLDSIKTGMAKTANRELLSEDEE